MKLDDFAQDKTSERIHLCSLSLALASLRSQRSTQELAGFSGLLFEDLECGHRLPDFIALSGRSFWFGLGKAGTGRPVRPGTISSKISSQRSLD